MVYPESKLAQTVLQLCKANFVSHIVISPGSRNAPLTIGFTHDAFFTCYSIVDERCAAFFALGLAQQLQRPTAVVCTSGSALLNYYPAIAEAFYSDIPLVVISADRPPHKIDIGDGQTIRQSKVFANHILYSADLKEDASGNLEADSAQFYNETELTQALHTAILQKGPVHINVPFEEPLYKTVTTPTVTVAVAPLPHENRALPEAAVSRFVADWNGATRKLVLAGGMYPGAVADSALTLLATDPSVVVFTETISNMHHPNFFPGIDKIIAPIEADEYALKQLQPELILTFGGMVISKKVKVFLRNYPPKRHYHIDDKKGYDTYFCLTEHFKTDVNLFFEKTASRLRQRASDYRRYWLSVQADRGKRHEGYIKIIPFSDLAVYAALFKAIPDAHQLQIANSAAIRYAQLFNLNKTYRVFCNRGASGIEGSTATAIGASLVSAMPTTLLTGDLSFFYDSNAFWNSYIRNDFTVLVINNGGGGIFRILPGPKDTANFETYFETVHPLTAKPVCDLYGLTYRFAADSVTLERELLSIYDGNLALRTKPVLLEIFTPRMLNDGVLAEYFKRLSQPRSKGEGEK